MKQSNILAILNKASQPNISQLRKWIYYYLLTRAVTSKNPSIINLVGSLYCDIFVNKPEDLIMIAKHFVFQDQENIFSLLRKAIEISKSDTKNCTDSINQVTTTIAILQKSVSEDNGSVKLFIKNLFIDTIKNNPGDLPSLFPIFATACGDIKYKGRDLVRVNWDIVPM